MFAPCRRRAWSAKRWWQSYLRTPFSRSSGAIRWVSSRGGGRLISKGCVTVFRATEQVPIERVLLWGFMASGKTAVGARLAARLGWDHLDLDDEIVRRAGKPISEIFREDGETAFRTLET